MATWHFVVNGKVEYKALQRSAGLTKVIIVSICLHFATLWQPAPHLQLAPGAAACSAFTITKI